MEISFACVLWLLLSLAVLIGYVIVQHVKFLPSFARDTYLFGKLREKSQHSHFILDVPKSWFTHFYIVGTIANACILVAFLFTQLLSVPVPSAIRTVAWTLLFPGLPHGESWGGSTLLALLLYQVQVCRRLYECLFISVFSRSYMGLLHYGAGLALYSSFSLSAAAPALLGSPDASVTWAVSLTEVLRVSVGVAMFVWASVGQHQSLVILANLRKSPTGAVVGWGHKVPRGGLFEQVSCPQYLCEVLIYLGLSIVLGWNHGTCLGITCFVLANQMASALLTHNWYCRTFPGYPSSRSAIFPGLL